MENVIFLAWGSSQCKKRGQIFEPKKDKKRQTLILMCIFLNNARVPILSLDGPAILSHTAGTSRKKFRKNSGKTPETLSERFLEFPSSVRLGCPKPYNSRHLRLPEHFQNSLPPSMAGDASFFRIGSGEGLSELVMEFPALLRASLRFATRIWAIRANRFAGKPLFSLN